MLLTIKYTDFEETLKRVSTVLKQDKKITIESKVFTIKLPATNGVPVEDQTVYLYTRTKTILVKLSLPVLSYQTDEDSYLELSSKTLEDILATFKNVKDKPYQIKFDYQQGSYFVNSILSTQTPDEKEPEIFTFKFPYNPPAQNLINEIERTIKVVPEQPTYIKTKGLVKTLNSLLNVQKSTDAAMHKEFFVNFSDKYIYGRTTSTLNMFINTTGLVDVKLRLDSVSLLETILKSAEKNKPSDANKVKPEPKEPDVNVSEPQAPDVNASEPQVSEPQASKPQSNEPTFKLYNDLENCNLVIKTPLGIYIMNYLTDLEEYMQQLSLTSVNEFFTLNKEDFVNKINRLKLIKSKTEVAIVSDKAYTKHKMIMVSPEMTQTLNVIAPKGVLYKNLKFNLVPSVFNEMLQVINSTDTEDNKLLVYLGKTNEDAWVIGFRDTSSQWYTLTGILTISDLSQKSDEYTRIMYKLGHTNKKTNKEIQLH